MDGVCAELVLETQLSDSTSILEVLEIDTYVDTCKHEAFK